MKFNTLVSILVFIGINSIKNDSIIRVPNFQGRFQNITTKIGLINYEFRIIFKEYEYSRFAISSSIYRLEGIKNLNLLNLTELKNYDAKIYGNNNDSIQFDFIFEDKDLHNDLICKILYKTKYIDKMIYSYGILNNNNYKYFGGTPKNIIKVKKLKKFTFNKDDRVSKIIIRSPEDPDAEIYGNEIIDTLNEKRRSIKITDIEDCMICIPNGHDKLLNVYKMGVYVEDVFKRHQYYKLDKRQQESFKSISFIIGKKNITLNRDDIIFQSKNTYEYFLKINMGLCTEFIFGKKFMKLFEFSEINMETKEVSLFMNQKKKIITEIEVNNTNKKEVLNSNINSNYYIIIFLLSFIVFVMSITLVKNYHKNKKIQYFNEYYNI